MSNTNRNNVINRNDTSKPQQSDDSTIIRRTLVERGLRPVNDENLPNSQSSTITAITTITKQHEDEQRELQELNNKFAIYLDRVQYLEEYNQRLLADLNNLKQTWGGDGAELQRIYGPQLQTLRAGIDNALRDQALQELQLKRQEYDLWQTQQQIATLDGDNDVNRLNTLKQELDGSSIEIDQLRTQLDRSIVDLSKQQSIMDTLFKEINDLKNELDTQQLERIITENELQTLREHAAFQDAIYQSQRKELLSLSSPVLDVSRFYRTELAHAISDIRQDFEVLSQSQANELEEYYRVKTEQVRAEIESENERKRLLANEGVIESMDKTVLTSSIRDNQNDLTSLQTENKQLERFLDAIVDDLEKIQDEHLRERQSYDRELVQLQQQITDKQDIIDSLLQNNISLRFEMSTYRHLLDGEEQHMNKVEQGQQLQNSTSSSSRPTPSSGPTSSYASSPAFASTAAPTSSYASSTTPASGSYQTPNRSLNELETKKMSVQKTARGPISFDSVDLETDAIILVNEKYGGNDQSLQNWILRRQIDQQPEIIYQFPDTFSLRPRQTIRIFSKRSPHSTKSIGDRLIADRIDTWGIGQKMITRLIDDNNEEKANITQIFQ